MGIVTDEKIEVPVAVVVDEGTCRSPERALPIQSGRPRDIGERSIAIVSIDHIVNEIRDEDVLEAIVVVVGDGHRGRPTHALKSGASGDVDKRSIAVVLIEAVAGGLRRAFQPCPGQDENVEPSIVVVIEKRDSSPDRLDDIDSGFIGIAANYRMS